MCDWQIVCANVLDWAEEYTGPKFMACLCDPPYHLKGGFMSKDWDKDGPDAIAFQPETWKAIAEHLYPGAFLMAFGGSRTHHRMAVAMEDAGLILHPTMVWLNGQSFPKATRIDTQIDKAAGAEREVVETNPNYRPISGKNGFQGESTFRQSDGMEAITALAATWAGHRYGLQALKPCAEFILCAQKPYSGRPVESIVATGAGALWIDGARVGLDGSENLNAVQDGNIYGANGIYGRAKQDYPVPTYKPAGRWPPNVTLSHVSPHPCPACDGCEACGGTGWLEGCRRVGVKRVRGSSGNAENSGLIRTDTRSVMNQSKEGINVTRYADPDGTEQVDDWICVESCPVRALGEQSSTNGLGRSSMGGGTRRNEQRSGIKFHSSAIEYPSGAYYDRGTAARFYPQSDWRYEIEERLAGVTPFYYCAKSARRERDSGLDGPEIRQKRVGQTVWTNRCVECEASRPQTETICGKCGGEMIKAEREAPKARNPHPTVKPLSLLIWLSKLLAPPPEYAPRRLLVPFSGSGSEICGALLAGWDEVVGVEMEPEYVEIAEARCRFWAGWSERGHDDPKEILKEAAKEAKKQPEPQMELL